MKRVSVRWGKCKLEMPGEIFLLLTLKAFLLMLLSM